METVDTPKWVHVKNHILDGIRSGQLSLGQRLPSEQSLAEELKINHQTVRRGLAELAREGIIVKRPSTGSFINQVQHKDLLSPIGLILPSFMLDTDPESAVNSLLATGKTQANAQTAFVHHPVPGILLNAIHRILPTQKYPLLTSFCRGKQLWHDAGQTAVMQGAKGLLIHSNTTPSGEDLQRLKDLGVKIVLLGNSNFELDKIGLIRVCWDWKTILGNILDKFYELGHRRIAVVLYNNHPETLTEYCEGDFFPNFLLRTGLRYPDDLQFVGVCNAPGRFDLSVLKTFLDRAPRPTAIVVPDEFAANVVFYECQARNIRIPHDISIAAIEDHLGKTHPVPLAATNSVLLYTKVIEVAIQYLLRLLAGEEPSEQVLYLRSDIEWKASVGRAPEQ